MEEAKENKLTLQVKVQEKKTSKRVSTYDLLMVDKAERPVETAQLRISTDWTRADNNAQPETPEIYEISSFDLVNFIMTKGKKLPKG